MTHACATGLLFSVVAVLIPGPVSNAIPIGRGTPTGVLEGHVLFEGPGIPQATLVENTTDPQECGRVQSLENVIISPRNHGIKNVIVALEGVRVPRNYQSHGSRLRLDNRDCRFRPHVSVLMTGDSIEVVNSDRIFHTVHLYGHKNLNVALAPKQSKEAHIAMRPGIITVKCDIHGWMQAFIRIDDHPFHSVTAADGRFRIEDIPPGFYKLATWHESFGQSELSVTVEAGTVSRVTVYYRNR